MSSARWDFGLRRTEVLLRAPVTVDWTAAQVWTHPPPSGGSKHSRQTKGWPVCITQEEEVPTLPTHLRSRRCPLSTPDRCPLAPTSSSVSKRGGTGRGHRRESEQKIGGRLNAESLCFCSLTDYSAFFNDRRRRLFSASPAGLSGLETIGPSRPHTGIKGLRTLLLQRAYAHLQLPQELVHSYKHN